MIGHYLTKLCTFGTSAILLDHCPTRCVGLSADAWIYCILTFSAYKCRSIVLA